MDKPSRPVLDLGLLVVPSPTTHFWTISGHSNRNSTSLVHPKKRATHFPLPYSRNQTLGFAKQSERIYTHTAHKTATPNLQLPPSENYSLCVFSSSFFCPFFLFPSFFLSPTLIRYLLMFLHLYTHRKSQSVPSTQIARSTSDHYAVRNWRSHQWRSQHFFLLCYQSKTPEKKRSAPSPAKKSPLTRRTGFLVLENAETKHNTQFHM